MPLDLLFIKKCLTRMANMYKKNTMNILTRHSMNALHTKHSLISTGLMEESHLLLLPLPLDRLFLDFRVCFFFFAFFVIHILLLHLLLLLSNLYSNLNSSLVSGIIPALNFCRALDLIYILFLFFFAHITLTHIYILPIFYSC